MNIISFTKKFLDVPISGVQGVPSARSWRFWACLSAMMLSVCAFAWDPLFFNEHVGFRYGSGVLCIMVSYLALSAVFWELLLFGKPRGANLFLQWVALLPFTFFVARTFTKPTADEESTLLEVAWEGFKFVESKIGFSKILGSILPDWITDIFSHWPIAMALLCVVVALCFRKKTCKIGLLFAALVVGFGGTIAAQVSWQFVMGTLILVFAFVLMYNPYDEQCFYYNWIEKLSREDRLNSTELGVVSKVMVEAYERGRLSYVEVGELIRSQLADAKFDKKDLEVGARLLVDRLLRRYNFIILTGDASGVYLTIHPRLMVYNSLMAALAIYPRRLIVALIGIVWLISPLDIVPDTIPFFGVLDDAVITILSAKCIMASHRQGVNLRGPVQNEVVAGL